MDSAENAIDECDEKYDAYALLNSPNTRPLATIVKNGKESKKSEKKHNENNNGPTKQYASNSRGVFAQCLVTGSILLLTAGCGMPIGYSATLLPKLNQTNGTLHVDEDLGSWIASLHSLATPFGSLLSGPLMDAIGRRGALQVATIPMAVGWIVMGFAQNITSILAARLTSGFAVGLCAVPVQILISEIADPGLRGFLVGTPFVAYSFGILLVYALGATFEWRTVAFLGTVLPALALIALGLSPESPAWLVRRRKMEAANKALMWFRGDDAIQVKTEMAILESRARADIARMSSTVSMSQQASTAISRMLNTGVLKPLVIVNVFNILQISAGTYTIVFYAVEIISSVGVNIDNYLVAVITAVVRFAFCIVYCILLLKTSRRILAIISSVGTAAASLVLAGFLLARNGANGTDLDLYVVGGCIFVYVAANTLGILGLPGLMVGELFPQKARGVAGGCSFFIFNMSLFGVTKLFPTMKAAIGISGVFTVFGASALLLAVFVYVTMPETKGRTLQQIEDYFQEGNMLWVTRRKEAKINPSAVPLTTVISG